MNKEVKWIIICWILTFILYGLLRLITREYMKKHRENKGEKENEKGIKGPSETKEKINA